MTTHSHTTDDRTPMDPMRKTALAAGVLYLLTFAASIPALALKSPVLDHADFVLGAGSEASVVWAGLLDVVTGLAGVGTAVALYPVARRVSRTAAIGFVTTRLLEGAIIIVGVMSLLSIVTLRQEVAGTAGADGLVTTGQAFVALHDWTFLFGPGVMPALNALFIGTVMYRSGLVPRIIPAIGLYAGAPLLLISSMATLFGAHDQVSATAVLSALPIAAWEFAFGVWMAVKGFDRSPATEQVAAEDAAPVLTGAGV